MADAIGIAAHVFLGRDGFAGPARMHRHAGAVRDRAVRIDPGLQVVGRDLRVPILGGPRGDVDHAERHDEVADGDLVDRGAIGGEVQRGVDMGGGVFVHRQVQQVEAVFGEVEARLRRDAGRAEEGREIGAPAVAEKN